MMGRQINFYLMEEDIDEINNYLSKQGLIILAAPMKANKLELAESLFVKSRDHYITAPSLQNEILITFIETQNYYLPDILDSPIIEFDSGHMRDNRIKMRGRVYYTKTKIGNGSPKKNELFLKMADDFFKWIRKNFKNVKLKGYEEFLISERTLQWLNESKERKLGDFPEVLKQDIENRKRRVA